MLTNLRNSALVFPGIGIELSNKEKRLFTKYKGLFSPLFTEGEESAGADLASALVNDRVGGLTDLQNQIFAYCFSVGTFRILRAHNLDAVFTSGNSFGIYAALVAAGAISFTGGLSVLKHAYSLTTQCDTRGATGMSAVIGLTAEEIDSIIGRKETQTLVHINTGNHHCHTVGGTTEELALFNAAALSAGALKCVMVPISLPYHHPAFLGKVEAPFETFLNTCSWQTPAMPVVSTLDRQLLTEKETIIRFIARHLCHPINWFRTVEYLYTHGVETIFECGPGISLTQNARFIEGSVQWINMKNIESRVGI
jgi:[acyl-carrier-protein] S-malonyltransferase